jgi:hypothetical protein
MYFNPTFWSCELDITFHFGYRESFMQQSKMKMLMEKAMQ